MVQVSVGWLEFMVICDNLYEVLDWVLCVVIGFGLGQDDWVLVVFELVMKYCQIYLKFMVIDVDVLNLFSKYVLLYFIIDCIFILYVGEVVRLLNMLVDEVEVDCFNSVK